MYGVKNGAATCTAVVIASRYASTPPEPALRTAARTPLGRSVRR